MKNGSCVSMRKKSAKGSVSKMSSFICALRGIVHTIATERNMRIHLAFSFYVVLAGRVCQIEAWSWCAVLGCIGLVTSLECLNTAVETACDAISPDYSRSVGIVKDVAAGAVLCAAVIAALIGGIVFFNAECISKTIEFTKEYPIVAAAIVLTVPLWINFIFMRRTNKCTKSQKTQ